MSDLNRFVNIDAAVKELGEPQYGFFRVHVAYSSGRRRGPGQHFVSCESIPISEEEYRLNIEQANKKELARFYSNPEKPFRESYWRYKKRVIVPGWVQALAKMLNELEKA